MPTIVQVPGTAPIRNLCILLLTLGSATALPFAVGVAVIVICVCAFYFALASATELGQLAWLPEHSRGHFDHPRFEIALVFVGCGCGKMRQVAFISFVAANGRVELTWDFGGW